MAEKFGRQFAALVIVGIAAAFSIIVPREAAAWSDAFDTSGSTRRLDGKDGQPGFGGLSAVGVAGAAGGGGESGSLGGWAVGATSPGTRAQGRGASASLAFQRNDLN